VELGEVLNYEQPTKYIVKSINYDDNFKIPVLTAGKTFVLGHTNEKEGVFPANKLPVIIFDDFTTAIKFVNFPFKVKSSAMKILHAKKDKADARFLFELMKTIKFRHEQHKRYWISEYSKIKIPLPPLKVQKEILQRIKNKQEIINDAKELIAKTERERANSGQIFERLDCEWVALEDVCSELFAGGDVPKDHSKAKNKEYPIPIYSNGVGDNSLYGFTKKARVNQPCITISARGTIGYPELREEPFYPAIRLIVAIPKSDIMNLKFLKYVLEIRNINRSGNTIPQLTVPTIKKEMIPIPSLEIQKQVAGLFEKQSEAVRANKQLIKVFDQQIQDEISEVWG
jgi:type I restriction enzyme, S subunit